MNQRISTTAPKRTGKDAGPIPVSELFQDTLIPVSIHRYMVQYRRLCTVLSAFPEESRWPFVEERRSAVSRMKILQSYLQAAGYHNF